jgi:hypothetical protein
MTATKTDPMPPRVAARPSPDQWSEDELMSLPEAAALLWPDPDAPLSTRSLRTAERDGQLAVFVIAGKMLTTRRALAEMGCCRRREADGPAAGPVAVATIGTLSAEEARRRLQAGIAGKLAGDGRRRR